VFYRKISALLLLVALSYPAATRAEPLPPSDSGVGRVQVDLTGAIAAPADLVSSYENSWRLESAAKTKYDFEVVLYVEAQAVLASKEKALSELKKRSAGVINDARTQAAASYVLAPSTPVDSWLSKTQTPAAWVASAINRSSRDYLTLLSSTERASQEVALASKALDERVTELSLAQGIFEKARDEHQRAKDALTTYRSQVALAADGCPLTAQPGTLSATGEAIGIYQLCVDSVLLAPTPEAGRAIKYALAQLGAPYTQVARMQDGLFDCSSLVMRAYDAAGAQTVSRGGYGWAPTTWVIRGASWAHHIELSTALPGDLVFPHPGHVAMLLAHGQMVHTSHPSLPARVQDRYNNIYTTMRVDTAVLADLSISITNPWGGWTQPGVSEVPDAAPSDTGTLEPATPTRVLEDFGNNTSLLAPFNVG
jgi:cell wall-associated NlpC family hydrolase